MTVVIFFLTAVVVPMLVDEVTDWLPWVATRVIRFAASSLPPDLRERYVEEWEAELDAVPGGNLSRFAVAVRIWLGAAHTGAVLRGFRPTTPMRLKSILGRALAFVMLLLVAPLLLVLAVAIRLRHRGPPLFRQTWVGKDGQPSTVYKFRTMVVDAEARKARLVM